MRSSLKRNYAAHLMHGLLGQTGFRIIQAPTFLPAYVFSLTGSNSVVGIARAAQAFGMFLTPVLGATLIEHRRRVMGMVFATGALMRIQVLGLALAGFYLGREANLVAICLFLGLFGFFTGMQTVTFSFLVSKVIPVELRGSLVGLRNSLAGISAAAVGVVGGSLIDDNALGNGYAAIFLVSFALTAAGLLSLLIMKEPASPSVRPRSSIKARLAQVPALLRSDRDYVWYLVVRSMGISGRMAVPYYVLFAGTRVELTGKTMGWLTFAFLLANTGSNLLWGLVADRRGFRDVLVLALGCWIGSTFVLMEAEGMQQLLLGFVGLGAGMGGFQMGCVNLVLEFGERKDLPMRIALAQSSEQLTATVAPLAGGIMVELLSYQHLFWTTATLQGLALLVALGKLRDPRRH